MMPQFDWLSWASRFNQASLLPFLAFLWTISRIPDMPKKTLHGWYLYIVFIAVAIPAGIYSKTQLGTSMANVDWLHGPCEALLTSANLIIVLGLRDALQTATASTTPAGSTAAAKTGSAAAKASCSNTTTLKIDTAQDALDDMQYMRQLHDMHSSEHGTGEAPAAGTDLPVKGNLVSHLKGFEATAVTKAKKLDLVERAASVSAAQDLVALRLERIVSAEGTNSSTAVVAGARTHDPADAPNADQEPLSNMHFMQQLHDVCGSQESTDAAITTDPAGAAGFGIGRVAGSTVSHIQGLGAAATVNPTADAATDAADTSSQRAGSGPAVHALPRRTGVAARHSKPLKVPGAVQRPTVRYRVGCSKIFATGLRALAMS